jgi:hypothetical protein
MKHSQVQNSVIRVEKGRRIVGQAQGPQASAMALLLVGIVELHYPGELSEQNTTGVGRTFIDVSCIEKRFITCRMPTIIHTPKYEVSVFQVVVIL